jgi:hypothetical protein
LFPICEVCIDLFLGRARRACQRRAIIWARHLEAAVRRGRPGIHFPGDDDSNLRARLGLQAHRQPECLKWLYVH